MTLRETIAQATLQATKLTGIQAQLVDPRGTYSTSGTVAESPLEYAVWATDLRDESDRWEESGITATVYVAAKDVAAQPKPGWRLKYSGRVFAVMAVLPSFVSGTTVHWRLDVGEVAA